MEKLLESPPTKPLTDIREWGETPCGQDDEAAVEQAAVLLEQMYVHLPVKRTGGQDPVSQLRHLRARLPDTKARCYRALVSIFMALGDKHARCELPRPWASQMAFLPFLAKEYFSQGERRLTVVGSTLEDLRRGDDIVSWNGVPVAEMLRWQSAHQFGATDEVKHAHAVLALTFRPLVWVRPPEEQAVFLEKVSPDGRQQKVRLEWQVADTAWLSRQYAPLFGGQGDEGPPHQAMQARRVETSSGTFGYIQIGSFHDRPEVFLHAFLAILDTMPTAGLILDLRGCEEGVVPTAEQLLQLFTAEIIEPEPFQFRVTALVQHLVRTCPALAEWQEAVESATQQGEEYSGCRPLTTPEKANKIGQKYAGPVVVLVDAMTYSSAEMFAAGFQDHGIGLVLGTAPCTGGGGASVWHQNTIFRLSGDEMFRPLPSAPTFRVAARRSHRVRTRTGQALEGVGVVPDVLHLPTRRDRLHEEIDLLEKAGKILAKKEICR